MNCYRQVNGVCYVGLVLLFVLIGCASDEHRIASDPALKSRDISKVDKSVAFSLPASDERSIKIILYKRLLEKWGDIGDKSWFVPERDRDLIDLANSKVPIRKNEEMLNDHGHIKWKEDGTTGKLFKIEFHDRTPDGDLRFNGVWHRDSEAGATIEYLMRISDKKEWQIISEKVVVIY